MRAFFNTQIKLLAVFVLMAALSQYCRAEPEFLNSDINSSESTSQTLVEPTPKNEVVLPRISPAEAAELVRRKTGGQVMSVNTQQRSTGIVYGVKVLNAGRMKIIHVDGQTGNFTN
jgi:uncharacterized membrane protein YkoI